MKLDTRKKSNKQFRILRILEYLSKNIRSNPVVSIYFLLFCRKILEPFLLNIGLKLSSVAFTENLIEIKNFTKIAPRTILDIGAATGKWSRAANLVFPDARIYAFEPIPETFKLLQKNTEDISKIRLFNWALSDFNGFSDFWLNDFRDGSSLLKMTDVRKKESPFVRNARIVKVECRRLDSISEIEIEQPCFTKIDVEGAEKFVLKGMERLIEKIDVLQLEYCFKEIFDGQTKFEDILPIVKKYNLDLSIKLNTEYSKTDGSKLMCDFVFTKRVFR